MMNGPFSPTDVSTVEGDEMSVALSKRSSLKAVAGNGAEGQVHMGLLQILDQDQQDKASSSVGSAAAPGPATTGDASASTKPDAQYVDQALKDDG
jgi:hypothetical protein